MISRLVISFFLAVGFLSIYLIQNLDAHSDGTSIPGASTAGCGPSDCHGTAASTTTSVHIWTDSPTFVAGKSYVFHVTVASSRTTQKAAGCAVSVDNSASFSAITSSQSTSDLRKYGSQLTQKSPRSFGSTDSASWTFNYQPTKAGPAHIYAGGNAVNLNGNEGGDFWNKTSFALTVASAAVNDESPANSELQLYPNPAHDFIQAMTNDPIVKVQIYNASGAIVSESNIDRVDTHTLPSGEYKLLVHLKNGQTEVRNVAILH